MAASRDAVSEVASQRFGTRRLRWSLRLCAGVNCRRFTVAHPWLRKDGIFLGNDWLCSRECLEAAIPPLLLTRPASERRIVPRMPFRLLLLRDRIVSEQVLEAARLHCGQHGLTLGEALLELRAVTEQQLAMALAEEAACPFYPFPIELAAPSLQLPGALAGQASAAIVHASENRIVVGFVARLDRGLLTMIEHVAGRRTEGCFITAAHHAAQLAVHAGAAVVARSPLDPGRRDLLQPQRMQAAAIAHAIAGQALRSGAEQVRLGRWRDFLWARLTGSPAACGDSLFRLGEASAEEAPAPRPHAASIQWNKLQMH